MVFLGDLDPTTRLGNRGDGIHVYHFTPRTKRWCSLGISTRQLAWGTEGQHVRRCDTCLSLHSQDETVVFLGDLDPTTRLGNRGSTCKEM